jgi:hypothetical protein
MQRAETEGGLGLFPDATAIEAKLAPFAMLSKLVKVISGSLYRKLIEQIGWKEVLKPSP